MKALYILFAVAAVIISACSVNNEPVDVVNRQITIEAIQEGYDGLTKTAVKDGGKEVYWEPNDEIKVFYSGTGSRFASNNNDLARVAQFTGTLTTIIGFDEGLSESNPLWGLYPYRADATSNGTSVTTTLPAEQTARAGSFAKNTHITIGRSTTLAMGFYAVCGGLRFSLSLEGISKVSFESNNGEDIAGTCRIVFQNGLPVVQEVIGGTNKITLTAPGGGSFETGKWYYIDALPGTLSGGFKLIFQQGSKSAAYVKNSQVTIKRAVFGSIENVDSGLDFIEGGGSGSNNIVFADPLAKYACVEKYDTDSDGEVSYAEAAAVEDLDGLFTNWKAVTSFEEIKYFINAKHLGSAFEECSQIKSITLPNNITDLGAGQTFYRCSSLKSVVLPSGIKKIPNECFYECSNLQSIDIPSSVTRIGSGAFFRCRSLTEVTIHPGVAIDNSLFYECTSLEKVILPPELTELPYNLFYGCNSLYDFSIPEGVTHIYGGVFTGCTFVNPNTGISKISLPESVVYIGVKCFSKVKNILMPSSKYISIDSDAFKLGENLYVPSSLIEGYSVRTYWEDYVPYILPIEQYEDVSPDQPIDLGLSVKWAQSNVSDVTSWGNLKLCTADNEADKWKTYKFYEDESYMLTKYCTKSEYGVVDNLITLLPEDDEATVKWGAPWRMPTKLEAQELLDNCTFVSTKYFGQDGYLVKSKLDGYKNKYIFMPLHDDYWILSPYPYGFVYWTSSLYEDDPRSAYVFGAKELETRNRMCGIAIRAVCE